MREWRKWWKNFRSFCEKHWEYLAIPKPLKLQIAHCTSVKSQRQRHHARLHRRRNPQLNATAQHTCLVEYINIQNCVKLPLLIRLISIHCFKPAIDREKIMRQRKDDKGQDNESLFERLLREKRIKKLLVKNNAWFFGMYVVIALFAAKGMFTIQ